MSEKNYQSTLLTGATLDVVGMDDRRLLMESVGRLLMGVQPLTQWAPVFSNPSLMHLPGLRCKAFTVWFPTLIDFLGQGSAELAQLRAEVGLRRLTSDRLFEIADEFEQQARSLVSLFTRDDQIFLNDRRLQNVHGVVSQFFRPTVGIRWYSAQDYVVYRQKMADDDYHEVMRSFYDDMEGSTLALLDRCITCREWVAIGRLVQGDASIESIGAVAQSLGVAGTG